MTRVSLSNQTHLKLKTVKKTIAQLVKASVFGANCRKFELMSGYT